MRMPEGGELRRFSIGILHVVRSYQDTSLVDGIALLAYILYWADLIWNRASTCCGAAGGRSAQIMSFSNLISAVWLALVVKTYYAVISPQLTILQEGFCYNCFDQ